MNNDSELLRQYVDQGTEAAFTELVRRHMGLVYSVALRRVGGDAHLAEDVSQRVFTALARKAAALRTRPTLIGWLHASTLLASAEVVRGERRRKARENESALMHTPTVSSDSDDDLTQLRPLIDDALNALKPADRELVMLRYFERRSFADLGTAFRITDEAARKRVDRALDKIRTLLVRRGVTSSAASLAVVMGVIGATSIPTGTASRVAQHALAQTSAATGLSVGGLLANAWWPVAAAVVIGAAFIGMGRNARLALEAELARLDAGLQGIDAVRAENLQLARSLALPEARSRPRSQPAATTPRNPPPDVTARAPRPVSATLHLTASGMIAWNGEGITLDEFLRRLQSLRTFGDPAERLVVQAESRSAAPHLAYIIDEIRKAEINHLTVQADTRPDSDLAASWF